MNLNEFPGCHVPKDEDSFDNQIRSRFSNNIPDLQECERPNNQRPPLETNSGKSSMPGGFVNCHVEFPKDKSRKSTPRSASPDICKRCRTEVTACNWETKNDSDLSHLPVFQDQEFCMKVLFFEDDDADPIFIKESSGDIMLSEGVKFDTNTTPRVEESDGCEISNCVCPEDFNVASF